MPPPSGGTWPPHHLTPIHHRCAILDAWYRGDPDEFALVYGQGAGTRPTNRPSAYRGGVVGTLARRFWGQSTPQGENRSCAPCGAPVVPIDTGAGVNWMTGGPRGTGLCKAAANGVHRPNS